MTTPSPDEFERRTRELFDDSVERLNGHTRSRLTRARNAALDELKTPAARRYWPRPYWLGIPLGGLGAAVLVAVFLMNGREAAVPSGESRLLPLDDFDIVADTDNFVLIRDVEFYTWLADEGIGDANSSG
jgi:hypothetical protein